MYLTHTRPDIAYALSTVSQFMIILEKSICVQLWKLSAIWRQFLEKVLCLQKNNDFLKVEGYTYADWAKNVGDRQSMLEYFTFIGGNLVTWSSKKQNIVSLSSAETKYWGLAVRVQKLLWLKLLLIDLGYPPKGLMMLYYDNN